MRGLKLTPCVEVDAVKVKLTEQKGAPTPKPFTSKRFSNVLLLMGSTIEILGI